MSRPRPAGADAPDDPGSDDPGSDDPGPDDHRLDDGAGGGADPFAPPSGTSGRGARALTVLGALLALLALYVPPVGALSMAAGVVAHVKGDGAGLPVAAAGGVATVLGTALLFLVG